VCDLPAALGVRELRVGGRLGDLLTLWEAVFLGEPVLVYGATPAAASLAVFAIRSLVFPTHLAPLHPIISVTDPRFEGIVANPIGIVGVSNPVAVQMGARFRNVFTVGFGEPAGLARGRRPLAAFAATEMGTADLRGLLYANTRRVVAAVHDTVVDRPRAARTTISSDTLENKIIERGVKLARPVRQFAMQLMQTPDFGDFACALLRMSRSA
jgi:hypothetical protein